MTSVWHVACYAGSPFTDVRACVGVGVALGWDGVALTLVETGAGVSCHQFIGPIQPEGVTRCPYGVHGHVLKLCKLKDLVGVMIPDGPVSDSKTRKILALDQLMELPLRISRIQEIREQVGCGACRRVVVVSVLL